MSLDLRNLRRDILQLAVKANEGHIPSSLSILDILYVLFDKVLKIYPDDPNHLGRDYFILSKGHASLALYIVLAYKGFFSREDLEQFATFDSILGGHPDRNKIPGIEASTGSLGHGMPIAVGIAMGLKTREATNRVVCLIGDGESNEGTVWESALLAAHHQLNHLICVIDHNHSTDRALAVDDLGEKFAAFGWKTITVNGHDHREIYHSLAKIDEYRPLAIIANTIKGHGFKAMENNPAWHHKIPNAVELREFMEE